MGPSGDEWTGIGTRGTGDPVGGMGTQAAVLGTRWVVLGSLAAIGRIEMGFTRTVWYRAAWRRPAYTVGSRRRATHWQQAAWVLGEAACVGEGGTADWVDTGLGPTCREGQGARSCRPGGGGSLRTAGWSGQEWAPTGQLDAPAAMPVSTGLQLQPLCNETTRLPESPTACLSRTMSVVLALHAS